MLVDGTPHTRSSVTHTAQAGVSSGLQPTRSSERQAAAQSPVASTSTAGVAAAPERRPWHQKRPQLVGGVRPGAILSESRC